MVIALHQVPRQNFLHKIPAPGWLGGGGRGQGGGRAGLCRACGCVLYSRVLGRFAAWKCFQTTFLLCFDCICLITCLAFCYVRSEKILHGGWFIFYFMAKAAVQQVQESSVLQVVTLFLKVVMVSEQAPVRVALMVISWQLDSMVELQLDKTEPWLAAVLADLKTQVFKQLSKERVSSPMNMCQKNICS